jgi:eukaryotic-like serine/threonine-protein kinase
MSVSVPVFWNLLGESRLLAPQQCQQLAADFAQVKGADPQGSARALAEWLVSRNVLSRYQTTVLLAGRAGPFHYGDYTVYDRVEKGRLAGAFRAVHAPTGHPVALTFLTGPVIQDPQRWAEAVHQTLASTAIVSPFVQRCYEPVDLQTFKFIAGEDLRGSSLDERLQHGRFTPAEACRLVRMAALGLAQMHQTGRAHGDIRPANLLLEPSGPGHPGHIKLLFQPHIAPGPINFADSDPNGPLAQMADFLAPELMQPGRVPDAQSDIYALGCTLYYLLTGTPPFAGGTAQQKMNRHATEAIRPLESFGIGPPLAQLVPYLMAKNPAVRFQSAAIVAEQLAPLVDPALVNSYPSAVPPTMPGYENWIHQKRQQMAAVRPAAQPVQPAASAIGVNLNMGPVSPASPVAPAVPAGAISFPAVGKSPTTSSSTAAEIYAKRKAKKQQQMLIGGLGSLALLVIAGVVALNLMGGSDSSPTSDEVAQNHTVDDDVPPIIDDTSPPLTPTTNTNTTSGTNAGSVGTGQQTPPVVNAGPDAASSSGSGSDSGPKQEVVPDDGQLLWASPTSGPAPSFRLVPPDGHIFLHVRPSDMLASPEGARVIDALGPEFATQREAWEKASGFELSAVDRMLVTFHSNDAKFPRVSLVVTPKDKLSREELIERWGNPAEAKEGQATYYKGPQWSFFLPADADENPVFLMSDEATVKEVAAGQLAPPHLNVERLRKTMDGDRHFTVLLQPSFLFNDDFEPLFAGERQKLREPIRWFIGDNIEAAMASMHFGEEFYLEMRMLGSLDKDKYQLAKELRERLPAVRTGIEDYFVNLNPPPYWKKLAFRYPLMISTLHQNTRVGVESELAVVNAVLPGAAAHNLVLGGELLVASAPGDVVAAGPSAPAATGPKTIEEVLAKKTTLTFDALPFDNAMGVLASDAQDLAKGSPFGKGGASEFTIKILASDDLEPEGITQQQTVRDFKQEDKTVAEILTALVMKANPVTTVKEPTETDQKLIWVVGPDPDNPSKQMILITTRTAAAKKKYKLPDVFVPKG